MTYTKFSAVVAVAAAVVLSHGCIADRAALPMVNAPMHSAARPLCFIRQSPTTIPAPLTAEQCQMMNEEADLAAQEAQRQRQASRRQAADREKIEQQNRSATLASAIKEETAAGYKNVTVKDPYLDAKLQLAARTKLSVTGFYKRNSPNDERLYGDYNEMMMRSLTQQGDAVNVGLITEDGSRRLREYLLRCVAGCQLTILGHVEQCSRTRAFGSPSKEFCLIANEMRPAKD